MLKAKWVALPCIVLLLNTSAVYANEILTSDIMDRMQKEYIRLCVANTKQLVNYLRQNNTPLAKGVLAFERYIKHVTCEPISEDPLYKTLNDPIVMNRVDSVIKRKGIPKYILDTKNSLSDTRKKYHIDEYESRMRGGQKLTIDELSSLIAFAKASARSGAVMNILRDLN